MVSERRPALSRRERQAMEIIYAAGHATAGEVREAMADAPSDGAVRATLRSLVDKGHLQIRQDGPRYDYFPTVPREKARSSELAFVRDTFFGGSTESAMAALLELSDDLDEEQVRRLRALIDHAAREGR